MSGPSTTDLLLAEPPAPTDIRIGYARVSTGAQNIGRQTDALKAAGCRRIFAEKKSGRDSERPELTACLEFLDPGDTLVVPSLDRLSRSLQDLITTVGRLRSLGVGFTSLHETSTPLHPAAGSSSTSSQPSMNSSVNSSSPEPMKASLPHGPGAASEDGPASPPRTSSGLPGTCCPTPKPASHPSPNCSASAPAPCTTTYRT